MGTMAAGRGVGCVISGPVIEALLSLPRWHVQGVYGTRFRWLIVLTGSLPCWVDLDYVVDGDCGRRREVQRMWRLGQWLVRASHLFSNLELEVCSIWDWLECPYEDWT